MNRIVRVANPCYEVRSVVKRLDHDYNFHSTVMMMTIAAELLCIVRNVIILLRVFNK